jgi:uncharacterized protein (TIGR03435 family)
MNPTISRREITRLCIAAACNAAFLRSQAVYAQPAPIPQFDVSTVKPTSAASNASSGISTSHGLIDARNVTLQRCIIGAYSIGPHQVSGGPDWAYSDRWDILAKSDQPIDDDDVLNKMLQALLADRFKLTLRRETRTLPAYVIEVDKNGPKLEKAEGGNSVTNTYTTNTGRVRIEVKRTDMDAFAQILARTMDLPVVNQTGLAGIFNFTLRWTLDSAPPSDRQTEDDVSIFTALPEQLGLRLHAAKAPVEVLVIDHTERPTPN